MWGYFYAIKVYIYNDYIIYLIIIKLRLKSSIKCTNHILLHIYSEAGGQLYNPPGGLSPQNSNDYQLKQQETDGLTLFYGGKFYNMTSTGTDQGIIKVYVHRNSN